MSTLGTIREHGLIAVIDAPIEERVFDWAMAVSKGGIELLGVPVGLANVTEIVSDLDDANLTVGITGVVLPEQVSIAVAAGGEFLFSPLVDEEIIAASKARGLVTIVGALTPTEVHRALAGGADLVAIHPVGGLSNGVEHFRAIAKIFPNAPLLVSGGVDVETAPAFLEAGAAAAVVDRGVFPEDNDPSATDVISMRAVALVEVCAEALGMPKRSSFTELRGLSEYPASIDERPAKDGGTTEIELEPVD